MNILVITEKNEAPSELFIKRELDALKSSGHKLTVIALDNIPNHFSLNVMSKDFFKIIFYHSYSFSRAIKNSGKILHIFNQYSKPDLIYAHFASITSFLGHALSKLWNIPFAVSMHANDIFSPKKIGLTSSLNANGITVCSQVGFRALKKYTGTEQNVVMIHHGLDLTLFPYLNRKARKKQILFAGRLCKKKGLTDLLYAFADFQERNKEYKLIICGSGNLKFKLHKLTIDLGMFKNVEFRGFVSQYELMQAIGESEILCHPSIIEKNGDRDGIPNIILEAMALGTPVLGTTVGGIPEVIIDNYSGFLVEPNSPKELSTRMDDIIKYNNIEQVKLNARNIIVGNFDINDNIKLLENFLQEIINGIS